MRRPHSNDKARVTTPPSWCISLVEQHTESASWFLHVTQTLGTRERFGAESSYLKNTLFLANGGIKKKRKNLFTFRRQTCWIQTHVKPLSSRYNWITALFTFKDVFNYKLPPLKPILIHKRKKIVGTPRITFSILMLKFARLPKFSIHGMMGN